MASDHWKHFLGRELASVAGDVVGVTIGLPAEARGIVLSDWARGQDALRLGLQVRFWILGQSASPNDWHGLSR